MNIRTKIIGGYVLFVLLILGFLGVNYGFARSIMKHAERIYDSSADIKLEMETENVFHRQVISLTDYFLTGEEEYETEFHNYSNTFLTQIAVVESTSDGKSESEELRQLLTQYNLFIDSFDRAAAVHKAGRLDEARELEANEVDLTEQRVEKAMDELIASKRAFIVATIGKVRAYKKYGLIFPSLPPMVAGIEAINNENQALQHALEAESVFLKQVISLTDLFLFNNRTYIDEFHEYGNQFQDELESELPFIQADDEQKQINLIAAKHLAFSNAFSDAARIYQTGDRALALRQESGIVDPLEDEVALALTQFYPLKQGDMKRALDDVKIVNTTSLSITRQLGIYILFALMIGLFIGTGIAVTITRPIRQLAEATEGIASGDFTVRLGASTRDEVGRLAMLFNRMAETLQRTTVSKDYVAGIIKSMADSLIVTSAKGDIVTVNPATCRMLGYTEAELLGKPLEMLFAKIEGSNQSEIDRTPVSGTMNDVERVYLGKDGRRIPISFSSAPMRPDSSAAIGLVCLAQDITERKRADQALRESQQKLSFHIQQTPLAVIEVDLKTQIVEWNPAAETIFGYSRGEAIGRDIYDIIVPKSADGQPARARTDISSHKSGWRTTNENLTKDGRTIICEWFNTPLKSQGTVVGIASMVQDSTERAQILAALEQARDSALESARLKSEFLANMSHEIRTPMNGVIGMTGLLLDTDLSAEQHDFAETIRYSGNALLTIINDILDFSKIEAGKLQFETLDFDLINTVESTIELLAERAQEKKIELASLIHSEVSTMLRGDPGRLRQILTNLIGNAIKFTERGEVVICAERETETADNILIRFSVTDTGIGIGEAAQLNLFQAFTQADGSTTRKYGGTGLGLAISKQLVELMGGQIGVVSEKGKGSTFWFTASFEKQPADAIVAAPRVQSLTGLRVLIVDDNATNRKILSHQLTSWGTIHQEADSGVTALQLLRDAAADGSAYDLAVLDLMMPEMDGFELAHRIKSDLSISEMKLVMLTSFGERGQDTIARDAGISGYLTKPVRQSQLFDLLIRTMCKESPQTKPIIFSPQAPSGLVSSVAESRKISHKLILVAEDNSVNQKIALRQLQKLGFRADAVANGLEALEAMERVPYDLVLMDCQMPEMDGYDATTEIRRREGTERHTPIVAMTAHALETDRLKCLAAGMDDYVSKPVKFEDLEQALQRRLGEDSVSAKIAVPAIEENPLPEEMPLPMDLAHLRQVLGDEPLSDILGIYLEQLSENLAKLDSALGKDSPREVELLAHKCIGASASCGVLSLIDPLRELERMGREDRLAGASVLRAQVADQFNRERNLLQEKLEE